jgi:Fimbrial assembly protein (PilN)
VSQQINLFNPIFLKQEKLFSAVTMAQALGLILLGSAVLIAYSYYQSSSLGIQAAANTTQLALAQTQLAKVNADFGPRQKSKLIEDDIQKTETEMKSLQQVFDILQKGEFGNTKGYAEYLRAFSRQILGGVWLTGFSIYGAGSEIGLQGRALQPELVPAYISRLKQEPVMQGKSFATLEMQLPLVDQAGKGDPATAKQHVPAGYIEFNLQSSGMMKEQSESSRGKSK